MAKLSTPAREGLSTPPAAREPLGLSPVVGSLFPASRRRLRCKSSSPFGLRDAGRSAALILHADVPASPASFTLCILDPWRPQRGHPAFHHGILAGIGKKSTCPTAGAGSEQVRARPYRTRRHSTPLEAPTKSSPFGNQCFRRTKPRSRLRWWEKRRPCSPLPGPRPALRRPAEGRVGDRLSPRVPAACTAERPRAPRARRGGPW